LPRRGPLPRIEERHYQVLSHLPTDKGVGFNELWRKLKSENIGVSFSTLTRTLNSLRSEKCVKMDVSRLGNKIPSHLYSKTSLGAEYEELLRDKLGLLKASTKRVIKAHRAKIRYDEIIFGEIPYTCEVELSSKNLTEEKEKQISIFVGSVGETVVSSIAEILGRAYSGFISILGEGRTKEAVDYLKKMLSFNLRLTVAFDGHRVAFDESWDSLLQDEEELLNAIRAVKAPSYSELLGCWILSLLSPLMPAEKFPYDLTSIEGWTKLITDNGNKLRASKGLPLLSEQEVQLFLKEQMQRGAISIRLVRREFGLLEFHEKMPEPQPEEFYSFLLGLFSAMKSLLENKTPEVM
jgi:DNA-binding HxlR family transcriptional regulator